MCAALDIAIDPSGASYDVVISARGTTSERLIRGLRLPMMGEHNVQNSLAAIAVAHEMGADDDTIRKALADSAASSGASPAPARSTASS
jgi:UDP-N-acetylmuramate-alanine ligase